MNPLHAAQNPADRAMGEAWERRFCEMATGLGMDCRKTEPPMPGWRHILPDRTIRRDGKWERHELKHKAPTATGEYGLEEYRLDALLALAKHTGAPVLYTIHDWKRAGANNPRAKMENRLGDWVTHDVTLLADAPHAVRATKTYYGGETTEKPTWYWPSGIWQPLASWWGVADPNHVCGWARVENGVIAKTGGTWTCVQDHYAVGIKPETACGATLPEFA